MPAYAGMTNYDTVFSGRGRGEGDRKGKPYKSKLTMEPITLEVISLVPGLYST
jgi:hypothetical protein